MGLRLGRPIPLRAPAVAAGGRGPAEAAGLRLALLAVAAAIFALSVLRLDRFGASALDLGSTGQSLYLIAHGNLAAYNTVLGQYTLDDVASWALYLLALPFRFLGGVYLLFALQGAAVALFGWAVYRRARRAAVPARAASAFALLVATGPAFWSAASFDFHVDFLALGGIALALLCEPPGAGWWAGGLLALLSKNVAAVPLLLWSAVGALGAAPGPRRRAWLRLGLLSVLVLALDELVVPRLLGGGGDSHLWLYARYGNSAGAIAGHLVTHPGIVAGALGRHWFYLAGLVAPLGWLPLLGPAYLLPWLAVASLNALAADPAVQRIGYQYAVLAAAFAAVAGVEGLGRLCAGRGRRWVGPLLALGFAASAVYGAGVYLGFERAHLILPGGAAEARALGTLVARVDARPAVGLWTDDTLGATTFARPALGVSGVDGIGAVWRAERGGGGDPATFILLRRPSAAPVENQTVARALAGGYRLLAANPYAFLLEGGATFVPPPGDRPAAGPPRPTPATAGPGQTPPCADLPLQAPALLAPTAIGRIDPGGSLAAPAGARGILASGPGWRLPPGAYVATFRFRSVAGVSGAPGMAAAAPGGPRARVEVLASGTPAPLAAGSYDGGAAAAVSVRFHLGRPAEIDLRVVATGVGAVRYGGAELARVPGAATRAGAVTACHPVAAAG